MVSCGPPNTPKVPLCNVLDVPWSTPIQLSSLLSSTGLLTHTPPNKAETLRDFVSFSLLLKLFSIYNILRVKI